MWPHDTAGSLGSPSSSSDLDGLKELGGHFPGCCPVRHDPEVDTELGRGAGCPSVHATYTGITWEQQLAAPRLPCVPVSLKAPCTHPDPSSSLPGPGWAWEEMRMRMPGWGEGGGELWLLHVGFVLFFLLRYLVTQVPR